MTANADVKPIYKGGATDKVSLMFNVYWGTEYLDKILDELDEHGVKTTFFVGGSWVRDNEAMFKKIVERGHEIGNHGFFTAITQSSIGIKTARKSRLVTSSLSRYLVLK